MPTRIAFIWPTASLIRLRPPLEYPGLGPKGLASSPSQRRVTDRALHGAEFCAHTFVQFMPQLGAL